MDVCREGYKKNVIRFQWNNKDAEFRESLAIKKVQQKHSSYMMSTLTSVSISFKECKGGIPQINMIVNSTRCFIMLKTI